MKLPGQAPQKLPPTRGTTTGTPLPRVGDVLNYVFLFAREAQAGRDEGAKARPVMVMSVVGRRVTVMPLTTKGEDNPASSLPIPDPVAKAMGLRGDAGSSLVPGELNAFDLDMKLDGFLCSGQTLHLKVLSLHSLEDLEA